MATDKKSFILYADIIGMVEKLPDDQAGRLFKIILDYVNDKDPEVDDLLLQIAFEPIKLSLKRDLSKWVGYIKKQSDNGKKGGRPPIDKETQKTQPFLIEPKKADSVSVSVSVSDSVSVSVDEETIDNDFEKLPTNDKKIFEMFRRAAPREISDATLIIEVGKFRNKYPDILTNQSGPLVNAWVAKINTNGTVKKSSNAAPIFDRP